MNTSNLTPMTNIKQLSGMELPEGKTCNDCKHCYRCTRIFGAKPENKECDFYPIRFLDKDTPK